jgi:uncharacterized membrane-anchored protein YhcB (DUF1043 family)
LIAQEVQRVLPEVVYQSPDGLLSVNYAEIVPILIEALKTHMMQTAAQNADLQTELQTLKDSISNVESHYGQTAQLVKDFREMRSRLSNVSLRLKAREANGEAQSSTQSQSKDAVAVKPSHPSSSASLSTSAEEPEEEEVVEEEEGVHEKEQGVQVPSSSSSSSSAQKSAKRKKAAVVEAGDDDNDDSASSSYSSLSSSSSSSSSPSGADGDIETGRRPLVKPHKNVTVDVGSPSSFDDANQTKMKPSTNFKSADKNVSGRRKRSPLCITLSVIAGLIVAVGIGIAIWQIIRAVRGSNPGGPTPPPTVWSSNQVANGGFEGAF